MDIVKWIEANRRGTITTPDDHIETAHDSGEHSTLWKVNDDCDICAELELLGTIYQRYDGMDLFSSTFKLASRRGGKGKSGVELVFTLGDLKAEVANVGAVE